MLIQYIIKKKNKNEKVYEADFEYLWKGNPNPSLQLSVKRVIEIICGLPGIFILLLGVFSILSGEMTLAFGLISIGIPFCWLGVGNLILIQYMKKRSEYYLTKKEVVVIKHYKKDLMFKIPFENIEQIYCFSKTKTTITLKLAAEDLIERLAHKGEEDVLYDLRMEDAEKIIEFIRQYAGHEVKSVGYNAK